MPAIKKKRTREQIDPIEYSTNQTPRLTRTRMTDDRRFESINPSIHRLGGWGPHTPSRATQNKQPSQEQTHTHTHTQRDDQHTQTQHSTHTYLDLPFVSYRYGISFLRSTSLGEGIYMRGSGEMGGFLSLFLVLDKATNSFVVSSFVDVVDSSPVSRIYVVMRTLFLRRRRVDSVFSVSAFYTRFWGLG